MKVKPVTKNVNEIEYCQHVAMCDVNRMAGAASAKPIPPAAMIRSMCKKR